VYVALSNILYAYSMRTGMSRMTNVPLFAAWDARLRSTCCCCRSCWFLLASLRCSGALLIALPLQLILGTVFARWPIRP